MPKWAKWLIGSLIFIAIVSGICAFLLLGYLRPYRMAQNTMSDSTQFELNANADGTIRIRWQPGSNAGGYSIQVLDGETVIHSADVGSATEYCLPTLPDRALTIQVSSYQTYRYLFPNENRVRPGETSAQIFGNFTIPMVTQVECLPDPEADSVAVSFQLTDGAWGSLYLVEADGTLTPITSFDKENLTLKFGENRDLPMPGHGEQLVFSFDAHTHGEGYTFCGLPTPGFTVDRQALLGDTLTLECTDLGNNQFSFTWNETKGDGYALQLYDSGMAQWLTLLQMDQSGQRTFSTGHLDRYSDYTFRITATGVQVTPAEVTVSTGASVVYSTIWPIKTLEVYTDTDRQDVLTTAAAGKALCVLDVKEGLFYVRTADGYGYIDSNYCMINLPDMIGDICLYDITNSYDSLYMVHEYEIPKVTGTVIKGYEDVELYKGNYLVPLLYPTALKLEKAAFSAISLGYKLKIYDSYRPNKATLDIYELAKGILENPIPEDTYSGEPVEDLPTLPEPEEGQEPPVLTYQMLMTDNGRYSLANFLALGGSRHNQGIAMDLTLTKNGKDLKMQTSIHDLSWYSEIKRNQENAKLLRTIMEGAGFGGLTSEWWHYQDNDAKRDLEPPYMKSGVSPEGWVANDTGWRYRRANGKYYTSCEKTIDGITYRFDENGYVVP
jgi:D-alanyl-D-alanine dipeptidase